jgi:hypothetical protein
VKTICVGVERVRECNAQQLRRQFDALTWKDGESVEDFSVHITGLASNLRTLGVDITNATIVHNMLDVVPEHLEQIAVAVETFLDLNTVTRSPGGCAPSSSAGATRTLPSTTKRGS